MQLTLSERGISVEVAWILRGFCKELNLSFLFEREREGYKRFADYTVGNLQATVKPCTTE